MKIYNYNGRRVYLRKSVYKGNETLAIVMFKENGESVGTITVNLDNPLQSDSMAFLDEKTFPGIRRWVRKNKIGEFTGYEAYPGSCSYPLYTLHL